jgi:uncharacterized protein (DUF2062 family)
MTAARYADDMGMTHIITVDADLQHHPEDIDCFLPVIDKDPTAIVVGNRGFQGQTIPGSTRFGRKFSNFWFRVQTGFSLGDTQSGFRAYPVFMLLGLKLAECRYSFEIEVLVKAAWAGIRIHDIDISVYYPPKNERVSHFDKIKDNLRLTHLNARLTARALLPWPHKKLSPMDQPSEVSIFHPLRSVRMLLAEHATPGRLAVSGALGVLLGTLPLVGFHTVSILFAASFFRLNKAVAVATSQIAAPPIFPAVCIELGYYMRNGEFLTEVSMKTLGNEALYRLYEWLIGSLVFGPVAAAVVGGGIYATAGLISRRGAANDGKGRKNGRKRKWRGLAWRPSDRNQIPAPNFLFRHPCRRPLDGLRTAVCCGGLLCIVQLPGQDPCRVLFETKVSRQARNRAAVGLLPALPGTGKGAGRQGCRGNSRTVRPQGQPFRT